MDSASHRSPSAPLAPRVLGATGLPVTRLGLGLAALGRPAYINVGRDDDLGSDRRIEDLERQTHRMLDTAYQAGVRYVDAARSYGRAEAFLASWLDRRGLSPGAVTVGSKWGYRYVGDWRVDAEVHEVKDHSLPALRRQLAESRQLLGDQLRLYQVHSATLDSGVLEDGAVLAHLVELGAEGLAVGLSVSGPAQAATVLRALDVEVDGINPFRCVQATWNLLERAVGSALAAAHDAGWGVIVKESVANGKLTPRGEAASLDDLGEIARRHETTVDAVAIAAALAQPWADVVLSGAATVTQLDSNLAALGVDWESDDLDRLSTLAQPPEEYWNERSELPWQ